MSGRNFRDKRKRDSFENPQKKKVLIDENSVVVQEFMKYAAIMNDKQDKYERLVKISRDVTIESKRVIFLLHTIIRSDAQKVLEEAETRLNNVIEVHLKSIKTELIGTDIYQYLRAFTGGLQEFIEAYTFLYYLKTSTLQPCDDINSKITELCGPECSSSNILPISEFMLGVADLSGELMRYSISSVATGGAKDTSNACCFVRDLYVGMLQSGCHRAKEMGRKFSVLRQSLQKMEKTVYTLRLRGSEMPNHMLAESIFNTEDDDGNLDEGFF